MACPGKWHKTLLCSPVNAVGVSRARVSEEKWENYGKINLEYTKMIYYLTYFTTEKISHVCYAALISLTVCTSSVAARPQLFHLNVSFCFLVVAKFGSCTSHVTIVTYPKMVSTWGSVLQQPLRVMHMSPCGLNGDVRGLLGEAWDWETYYGCNLWQMAVLYCGGIWTNQETKLHS